MFYGFDQYLWQPAGDPKRGIGVFFNFGASDGEANPTKYSYSMGIGGNGVVPGRPYDTFGIGWARTQFSDNLVPLLRQTLDLGLDHEDAIEMYYNASITRWLNMSCACGSSGGGGVRGWGRDGLGTGARGRGARARRALMSTTRRTGGFPRRCLLRSGRAGGRCSASS